jgi:hypothetical protein
MFSAEQLEIRALAREFAEGELRPHTARWDRDRALDDDIFGKLAELGFLGMRVPERYGGLGLDMSTCLLALEELAWGDASVALSVAIHTGPVTDLLLEYGSDEQKETWLPSLASGETLGAFALSETPSGSDVRSVDTTAVPEGAGWRIDGHKRWVTNGARAGLVFVFATTGGGDDPTLGVFMVSPQSAGYAVTATETTMGLRASEIVSVELDGVQVPSDRVLGDSANGLEYALRALDRARLGIAAQSVGVAQGAFEHAIAYALDRHQFGHAIADFGAIQFKLADMASRIGASRALLHVAAEDAGDGQGISSASALAAMAKLTASESAMWVADEAVQIFGGYGYMRDYPVEQIMRDAKGTEIYGGTNEIMRVVMAREILRKARGHP